MAREFDIPSRLIPLANRLIPRYGNFTPDPTDDPLPDHKSFLGSPVYSNLQFLKTSGTSLDNSLNVGAANGNSDIFLNVDTVLITVSQSKNIVKTPIVGRNGTIKEYISDGDYLIDIRGMIVSQYPLVYPRDEVSLLIELLNLPKQIPVASDFLNIFEIGSIVVEFYSIGEKLGSRNEVPFEIQAWSDNAEEIQLTSNA